MKTCLPVFQEIRDSQTILRDINQKIDSYSTLALVGNRAGACLALRQAADSLLTAASLLIEAERKAKDPSSKLESDP